MCVDFCHLNTLKFVYVFSLSEFVTKAYRARAWENMQHGQQLLLDPARKLEKGSSSDNFAWRRHALCKLAWLWVIGCSDTSRSFHLPYQYLSSKAWVPSRNVVRVKPRALTKKNIRFRCVMILKFQRCGFNACAYGISDIPT